MAKVTFRGHVCETNGALPGPGATAPNFQLTAGDLGEKSLDDYAGKKKVLSINLSFDTEVCRVAARKFNESLSGRANVVVLAVSADLPFAQKRFCEAEGLKNVITLSTFRSTFAKDYGIEIVAGPLKGFPARAVLVLDEANRVLESQLVPEITDEPAYAAVLTKIG